MALSAAEAFKFGFLLRCADENLSPAQTQERVKLASGLLSHLKAAGVFDTGLKLLNTSLAVPIIASGLAGAAGGYGLSKMTTNDVNPDDIKNQELIAAFQQQADRIRRTMAARRYRDASAPRSPRLA